MIGKASKFTVFRKLIDSHVPHDEVVGVVQKYYRNKVINLPYILYSQYGDKVPYKNKYIDQGGTQYDRVLDISIPMNFPGIGNIVSEELGENNSLILDDCNVSNLFHILYICIGNNNIDTTHYNKDSLDKLIKKLQELTGSKEYIPLNIPYNSLKGIKLDPRDITSFAKYKNDMFIEDCLQSMYQIFKDYLDLDLLPNEDRVMVYEEYNR